MSQKIPIKIKLPNLVPDLKDKTITTVISPQKSILDLLLHVYQILKLPIPISYKGLNNFRKFSNQLNSITNKNLTNTNLNLRESKICRNLRNYKSSGFDSRKNQNKSNNLWFGLATIDEITQEWRFVTNKSYHNSKIIKFVPNTYLKYLEKNILNKPINERINNDNNNSTYDAPEFLFYFGIQNYCPNEMLLSSKEGQVYAACIYEKLYIYLVGGR